MSYFDIFRKRRRTYSVHTINVTENGLEINGQPLDLPGHISAAVKYFGEPRATEYKTPPEMLKFLEEQYGKGSVTTRTNYSWDELGVYAFTMNGTVINNFGIRLSLEENAPVHYPKSTFSGKILINGKPWFDCVKDAQREDAVFRFFFGGYMVLLKHNDPDNPAPAEKDFVIIEIKLA